MSPQLRATWARLVEGLERIPPEQRDVQVLAGFLAELWEGDRDLAQYLLDSALEQPALLVFLPVLHSEVELDDRGVERLKRALNAGQVPVWMYRHLASGRTTDHLPGDILKDLLLVIADQPDGLDVALDILYMRLHSDRLAKRKHEPKLLEAGQDLLQCFRFQGNNQRGDYRLADVVKACLAGPDAGPIAAEVALRLRQAVATGQTDPFENDHLLKSLLEAQPAAVLGALFSGDERDQQAGVSAFDYLGEDGANPADAIPCDVLIAWCKEYPERRYPRAASIITFAQRPEADGPPVWSAQAKALLAGALDPTSVLEVLIERFRPRSWSGSRAGLIEVNARLLDSLESHVPSGIMPFVTEAKAQLAQEVERERQWETENDRARDERFE